MGAIAWKSKDLDAAGQHLAHFEDDRSSDLSAAPPWDWLTAADDAPEQLYALWRDVVARACAMIGVSYRR